MGLCTNDRTRADKYGWAPRARPTLLERKAMGAMSSVNISVLRLINLVGDLCLLSCNPIIYHSKYPFFLNSFRLLSITRITQYSHALSNVSSVIYSWLCIMSSASSSSYVRVQLAPKAGFCVKTSTLTPAVLPPPPTSLAAAAKSPSATPNERLEPPPGPILVPQGRKVFVNIAWDPNVPPPPEGTEEDVRRAMEGADSEEAKGGWYVPVIVSHAREDVDKGKLRVAYMDTVLIVSWCILAGKPSLLFDCIFNSGVKARMLRDPDFKIFLVGECSCMSDILLVTPLIFFAELALQRIEVQTGLALSRAIATPNIASKGKLLPRTITLPSSLIQQKKAKPPPTESGPSFANIAPKVQDSNPKPSPLIQEITTPLENPATAAAPKAATAKSSDTSLPGLRGILKKSNTAVKVGDDSDAQPGADMDPLAPLEWDWRKDDKGRLRIEVKVAGLVSGFLSFITFH